jgi:hypothetical protein
VHFPGSKRSGLTQVHQELSPPNQQGVQPFQAFSRFQLRKPGEPPDFRFPFQLLGLVRQGLVLLGFSMGLLFHLWIGFFEVSVTVSTVFKNRFHLGFADHDHVFAVLIQCPGKHGFLKLEQLQDPGFNRSGADERGLTWNRIAQSYFCWNWPSY